MPEVMIIGGGLSGLAAAWELSRLKISHTLIEVKKRLGGSIVSERRDNCVLDGGAFYVPHADDWLFLPELGLEDSLRPANDDFAVFKNGAQTLVDALVRRMTAPAMMRMAVSSLGALDEGGFGVCLENGMMLTARALIIAAPALYAERMMRSLQQEIAYRLFDFEYDHIAHVSLAYGEQVTIPSTPPADYPITHIHYTTASERVPEGGVVIQAGVRFMPDNGIPRDLVGELTALMGWSQQPLAERVDYWAERYLLRKDGYADHMTAIQHLLPDGVALIGSDYLEEGEIRVGTRVMQARAAAQKIVAWLKTP